MRVSLSLSLVPVKSGVSPENAAYINKRIPSQLANKMGSVFVLPTVAPHSTGQTRAGWLAKTYSCALSATAAVANVSLFLPLSLFHLPPYVQPLLPLLLVAPKPPP